MKLIKPCLVYKLLVISLTCFSLSFSVTKNITLDQFIEQIMQNNPAILSAKQQSKAMQLSLQTTGALPNPFLSYVSGQDQLFRLNQKIPNPVQTNTERNMAALDVDMSNVRVMATARNLTAQAKRLYFNAYTIERVINLAQDESRALEQMYQSSLKQYESNRVTQQDPLNMSLMRTEVLIKLEQLQQERRSLLAEASRLCNGDDIRLVFPPDMVTKPINKELAALQYLSTNTGNLDVVMANIEQNKSQLSRDRVNLFNLFEYEVGVGYMPNAGNYEWMAGLSLPWWGNKNAELGSQQDATILAASANRDDVKQRVRAEVADLYYKIQSADRILPMFVLDTLPKAEQSRNLARIAYEAGRLDFGPWALSEQRYLTMAAQYYRMLAERMSAEADLVLLVGTWR